MITSLLFWWSISYIECIQGEEKNLKANRIKKIDRIWEEANMQQETRVMFLWKEQLISLYDPFEQLQRSMKSTHTMRNTHKPF